MPREDMSMSVEEVLDFLTATTRRSLGLGTLDGEGWPTGTMAPFAFRDGSLFFQVLRRSPAFANIQRDSRVCCIVEQAGETGYYGTRCVVARGKAQEVKGDLETLRLQGTSSSRTEPAPPGPEGRQGQQDVLFHIPVDDVWSFDFSKMRRRF